jgi:methylglutaconyl-CoA hydratase
VAADAIEARLAHIIDQMMLSAPSAIAVTKTSFLEANGLALTPREVAQLAQEGWMQRAAPEGRAGLAAFQAKRRPGWYQ